MSEQLIEKKTIGEVERIVHGSGEWDGTGPVEFSNDGETWSRAWTPTEEHPHPQFARVEVYRKGVRIPTAITIRWDEQFPEASEEWAGKWGRSPMRHFGRTARMVGYRQTFRELLGDIVIEDEADDRTAPTSQSEPAAPASRDWAAEIAAAESDVLLDAIEKDGRAARIFTADVPGTELWRALRARRREIATQPQGVADAWEPADEVDHIAEPPSTPNHARPVPKDHLPPANRAARRKAARKKGGKR